MFKVATIMALFLSANFVFATHPEPQPAPQISAPAELPYMPPDNWGGKRSHILYESVIGTATGLYFKDNKPLAFGTCWAVGVIKEIKDFQKGQPGYKHGLFSRNDLVSDAVGCGIGVFLAAPGLRLMHERGRTTIGYNWELK